MENNLTVTGTVQKIQNAETKGTFTFRNIWMKIDEGTQYPQLIEVQFAQAKVALLDPVNISDKVTVDFNLRGKEVNGRVYTSLSGWRLQIN